MKEFNYNGTAAIYRPPLPPKKKRPIYSEVRAKRHLAAHEPKGKMRKNIIKETESR